MSARGVRVKPAHRSRLGPAVRPAWAAGGRQGEARVDAGNEADGNSGGRRQRSVVVTAGGMGAELAR
jgi:hypothetical protein